MKFFRSNSGASYVAPPPAVVDPRPGSRDASGGRAAPAPARRPASTDADAAKKVEVAPRSVLARAVAPAEPSFVPASLATAGAPDAEPVRAASNELAVTVTAPVPAAATAKPAARPAAATAAATATAPPTAPTGPDGTWPRRPPQPLTIASHQLAIGLGKDGEPIPGLARRFPHVLNRISALWGDPPAAAELIDDLLVDRRGGRRGFPADVLAELLTIRRIVVKRMVSAAKSG